MFEFLINIYNVLLYRPLFNALILICNYSPNNDFGIAIIALTIIIRLILYPLSVQAFKSQRALQKLQPQMQEIQKKFKDNKEKLAMETLAIYKKEKINPFSGLFLALIQLPVLIALYRVFLGGLNTQELSGLYSFIKNPGHINAIFLGIVDLSKANIIFAILAGIFQFFQTKMLLVKPKKGQPKRDDVAAIMQTQMTYIFPVVTVLILFKLPAALPLYWITSGLFSVIQQMIILKKQAVEALQITNVK